MAIGKTSRDSHQLVDLCVAMVAANVGRREALNSGKVRARRKAGPKKRRRVMIG